MLSSKSRNKRLQCYDWWKKHFYQPSDIKTYENVQKIATCHTDGYTTGSFLDYNYFNKHYKLIAIDLRKQQALMLIQKQFNKLILLEI